MGAGTQTTVSQSDPQPWGPSQKFLKTILGDAQKAYQKGPYVYQGSTVTPMSNQTQDAYSGIMDMAKYNANNPNGMNSQLQNIIGNGGFNNQQLGAMNGMQNDLRRYGANGLNKPQDQALQNYRETANGNYDRNANPGYGAVRQNTLNDVADMTNLNAAAAGRYGSGMHEGVLSRELGKTASNMDMNDYNNWLGRRDAANQGMASLGTQGASQRSGLQGSLFNAAQAGQTNMQSAYQGMKAPYTDMAGVGSAYEDLATRIKNDELRKFDAQNPMNFLQQYMSLAGMNGQLNSNTTTTQAPGPNPFLTALGVAGTGLSLAQPFLGLNGVSGASAGGLGIL
jgi:hypothetical protein